MELNKEHWSLAPSTDARSWESRLLIWMLGLGYFIWLILSSHQVGIPRDESVYLYAADRISAWIPWSLTQNLHPLSLEGVDRGFAFNHEHPALMKELFALSHDYLHTRWGWIRDPTLAYRIPTMFLSAITVSLSCSLAIRLAGLWAGLGAGLALMSMPRLFFHAHLACFDAPVMAMWLLIVVAYLRAHHQGGWWIPICGITLGLGLATKLNATFTPFLLLVITLYHLLTLKRVQHPDLKKVIKRHAGIASAMIFLGLGVFWLHWPWLYHDTWHRLIEYIQFHARHEHYPVDYFGTLYYRPPFPISFPWVMLSLTIPLTTLILMLWGMLEMIQRFYRRMKYLPTSFPLELLMVLNVLFALVLIALPHTPIFGGTKHWITSLPFLAIMAGVAFERIREAFCTFFKRRSIIGSKQVIGLSLVLSCICFVPSLKWTHEYGAHGPVWYNSLIGGTLGAAKARLPRDFWGYSSVAILPILNHVASPKSGIFWHNATGAAVWRYQHDHRLRNDLRSTGDWTGPYADWGIYHSQREKRSEELDLWWSYETNLPVDGYFVEGVQVIGLYQPAPKAKQGSKHHESASQLPNQK